MCVELDSYCFILIPKLIFPRAFFEWFTIFFLEYSCVKSRELWIALCLAITEVKSIFLKGLEKSVLELVGVNEPQNFRIRGQKIGFPVRGLILGSLKVKKLTYFFPETHRF